MSSSAVTDPAVTPVVGSAAQLARARKSCGVCADDQQMFQQMRRALTQQAKQATSEGSHATSSAAGAATTAAASSAASSVSSTPAIPAVNPTPLPCPPDSAALGRATWTFLHTMAAYYPDTPTPPQQTNMRSLITNFADFYPCAPCAEHLQEHVRQHPPPTHSRTALSLFLCNYHNDVNRRLFKKTFDCARLDERWKDGPAVGANYDCIEENSNQ